MLTVNALAAANRADRPGAVRVLRARGTRAAARDRRADPRRLNPTLALTGLLLTMYDGRTRLAQRRRARGARATSARKVFASVVPRSVRLAEAPSHGLPDHALRPALDGRRRVLPARAGGGRAWLATRPAGLGLGLSALLGDAPPGGATSACVEMPLDQRRARTRASRARASTRRRSPSSPRRSRSDGVAAAGRSCAPRPTARLRADRRRAPLARSTARRAWPRSRRRRARPTTARRCAGGRRERRARRPRPRSRRRAPTRACATSSG